MSRSPHVDRAVRREGDRIDIGQAPTSCARATISLDRVDRADRVAGVADRDQLRPRPELRLEVLEIERDVVRVDVDRAGRSRRGRRPWPCQVETFASWSRVVTTISSPGPRVAPIERPMWSVSVDMFWPNLISSGEPAPRKSATAACASVDHLVGATARGERAPGVGVRCRGSSRRRRRSLAVAPGCRPAHRGRRRVARSARGRGPGIRRAGHRHRTRASVLRWSSQERERSRPAAVSAPSCP